MRRDMDLIKFLLGKMESAGPDTSYTPTPAEFPGRNPPSEPELSEHCRLVVERGLARGEPTLSGWALTGLTWEGHDFLDNARDSRVWKAAKDAAGRFSFGVFTATLAEAAKAAALKALEKAF